MLDIFEREDDAEGYERNEERESEVKRLVASIEVRDDAEGDDEKEPRRDGDSDDLRVVPAHAAPAPSQARGKRRAVLENHEEVRQLVARALRVDFLVRDEAARGEFLVDHRVDVGKAARQDDARDKGEERHAGERCEVAPIMQAVKTAHGLAHHGNTVA